MDLSAAKVKQLTPARQTLIANRVINPKTFRVRLETRAWRKAMGLCEKDGRADHTTAMHAQHLANLKQNKLPLHHLYPGIPRWPTRHDRPIGPPNGWQAPTQQTVPAMHFQAAQVGAPQLPPN